MSNDNVCYICAKGNAENYENQLDGTTTHYHTACMNSQHKTLDKYGLRLGMRVIWEGEDEYTGSILCINDEPSGEGHFLSLRNAEGGVDEVSMSFIQSKMVNGEWIDFEDDSSDITRVHNDIEVSIDPVTENRMVVACTNSNGEPDFAFVRVRCTEHQREKGLDYRAAKKWAKENGYGCAMVAFNCEVDSDGQSIVDQFTWESASIISI